MIRVVLDTNVVLSAFLWGGEPRRILNAGSEQSVQLVATDQTIHEFKDVISRTKFAKQLRTIGKSVQILLDEYRIVVEIVEPANIGNVIKDDPKDDKFLAAAVGGKAIYVVSGDHHLLTLGKFQDVEIVSVTDFLARLDNPTP